MCARKYGAFVFVLIFAFFLYACGDLGMVLPSQGSYRVNARVKTPKDDYALEGAGDKNKDDYTLDVYSIVNKYSEIQPFFVNSVANDPDVRGLTVFVQDYSGVPVSRKVLYQLSQNEEKAQTPPEEPELPLTIPQETPRETPAGTEIPAGTETPTTTNPDGVAGDVSPGESPTTGDLGSTTKAETTPGDSGSTARTETGTGDSGSTTKTETTTGDSSSTAKVETTTGNAGSTTRVETTAGDPGSTTKAETTAGDSGSTTRVETTAGDSGSTTRAETTIGDSGSTTKAETTAGDSGSTTRVETTTGDSGSTTKVETTSGNSGSTTRVETTSGNSGSTTRVETTSGNSGSTAKAETTAGNSGSTAKVETTTGNSGGSRPNTAAPGTTPLAETPKPAALTDEIVEVEHLDQYLPAFRITEDLAIGRYHLVFQVMGKGPEEVLYRTSRPIYFLGDAKFTLEDIQSFLPMAVTGGRLIPMGINVMLKTEIKADERLDPYVIWYSGKKIIAQGRKSDGANALLWKTPDRTGFHSVRAEVFPLLPGDQVPNNMIGKIKELSLPVSSKSEGNKQFDESSGEFDGWYQLWGTLDDAKAQDNPQRRLVPRSQSPRWIPLNEMYSLFVGRNDIYALPGTPFKLAQDEQGTGRILLHLAALSEGSVLTIRFAGQDNPSGKPAEGTADLDLFLAEGALVLRIASGEASREKALDLKGGDSVKVVTVELTFTLAPDRFDAELRSEFPGEDPGEKTGLLSLALAKPVSGEGSVILGGGEYPGGRKRSAAPAAFDEAGTFGDGTLALDELAFSYKRLPLPQDEEELDAEISESVALEEAEPGAEQEPSSQRSL